jgi:enterochelin esterase-like enzyme
VTRRRLLLGAGAVALLGAGAAVAEPRVRPEIDRIVTPGPSSGAVPGTRPGPVVRGSFDSTARHASTNWSIAYPPGAKAGQALPFLLVLHGRGDDARAVLGSHALGTFLAQVVKRGSAPFALVAVDGGDHDYWHPRASGADPQKMLVDELLPLVASHGLRVDRFAVGGWSMGGYGALLLAERLGPSRITAVAVDSPAIWTRAADTAAGAFDSRQDFDEHDVLHELAPLRRIPVRVTCGTADPFLPGVRALLAALPHAEHDIAAGGHDLAWWRHAAPGQLAFVGRSVKP